VQFERNKWSEIGTGGMREKQEETGEDQKKYERNMKRTGTGGGM